LISVDLKSCVLLLIAAHTPGNQQQLKFSNVQIVGAIGRRVGEHLCSPTGDVFCCR
jgi:hypothetical protein